MTEDILFDNIYVGHSVEDARKLAEETYFVKKKLEDIKDKVDEKVDEDDEEAMAYVKECDVSPVVVVVAVVVKDGG